MKRKKLLLKIIRAIYADQLVYTYPVLKEERRGVLTSMSSDYQISSALDEHITVNIGSSVYLKTKNKKGKERWKKNEEARSYSL